MPVRKNDVIAKTLNSLIFKLKKPFALFSDLTINSYKLLATSLMTFWDQHTTEPRLRTTVFSQQIPVIVHEVDITLLFLHFVPR